MIALAIICAEILFWVFLLSGLFARYALRQKTLGLVLLALTPVVDIVLISLTYIDLHRGANASFFHGMAAVYVGFTVMFGPAIVRAMDAKFLRRYGGGAGGAEDSAAPTSSSGSESRKNTRRDWLKACAACGIAGVLISIAMVIVGLQSSFWLIYWLVVLASIVVGWPLVTRWLEQREAREAEQRSEEFAPEKSE